MNKKNNAALWTVQTLLAALFLYAGVIKLVMPVETLTAQSPFSGAFLRFIGVAETLGALGLILPGLSRIQPRLTPLAALGLLIIMIGATAMTAAHGVTAAAFPFVAGVLSAWVAWGRTRIAPHRSGAAVHAVRVA